MYYIQRILSTKNYVEKVRYNCILIFINLNEDYILYLIWIDKYNRNWAQLKIYFQKLQHSRQEARYGTNDCKVAKNRIELGTWLFVNNSNYRQYFKRDRRSWPLLSTHCNEIYVKTIETCFETTRTAYKWMT